MLVEVELVEVVVVEVVVVGVCGFVGELLLPPPPPPQEIKKITRKAVRPLFILN